MGNTLLKCLIAGAFRDGACSVSPALAGGGGGVVTAAEAAACMAVAALAACIGGLGGGMHGGGWGVACRRRNAFRRHGGGMHFGGGDFAGRPLLTLGSRPAFRKLRFPRASSIIFHHRFHRFAFFGAPYAYYADYNGCWRRTWTPYGQQWINVCSDYGYY